MGLEWKSEKLNMLSNVKRGLGGYCGRVIVGTGDLHSTLETEEVWGGGQCVFIFFILGLRIQSWHMQLVSHLVCTGLHVILCVKIKLMCHIAGHTDVH